jgi:hypothetical protein
MSNFVKFTPDELKNLKELCSPANWDKETDPQKRIEHRFDILEEVEKIYAAHEGRPPRLPLIRDNKLPPGVAGANQSDGLHISPGFLADGQTPADTDWNRYEAVVTVIHEGKHEEQKYRVAQSGKLTDDKLPDQLRDWKENQHEYIRSDTTNKYTYYRQSTERDAYSFEVKQVDSIFDSEAYYQQQYKPGRDNEQTDWQNKNEQRFGMNSDEKLDCVVRGKYLYEQLYIPVDRELSKNNKYFDTDFTKKMKEMIDACKEMIDACNDIKNRDSKEVAKLQHDLEKGIIKLAKDNNITIVQHKVERNDIREKIIHISGQVGETKSTQLANGEIVTMIKDKIGNINDKIELLSQQTDKLRGPTPLTPEQAAIAKSEEKVKQLEAERKEYNKAVQAHINNQPGMFDFAGKKAKKEEGKQLCEWEEKLKKEIKENRVQQDAVKEKLQTPEAQAAVEVRNKREAERCQLRSINFRLNQIDYNQNITVQGDTNDPQLLIKNADNIQNQNQECQNMQSAISRGRNR